MKKFHICDQGRDIFALFVCVDEYDVDAIQELLDELNTASTRGKWVDMSGFQEIPPEEFEYEGIDYELLSIPLVGDKDAVSEITEDLGFEALRDNEDEGSPGEANAAIFWEAVKKEIREEEVV